MASDQLPTCDDRLKVQDYDDDTAFELGKLLSLLRRRWKLLGATFLIAGVAGAAASYLITPEFTSATTFLPPQQQQNASLSALASLGGLTGIGIGGIKNPADQYVSLLQSVTVADRMIDRFHLQASYDVQFRDDARKVLARHTKIAMGKKDGLITISVDDTDPRRAADMANHYVDELRYVTSTLAVTEAQQRRTFFEKQMQDTKVKLIAAQSALQQTGFASNTIKAEPQAAAAQYAQLRAQATAAEIKLQTLRSSLAETAPELVQQAAQLQALRSKLDQLETSTQVDTAAPDYIGKYREFKYQETLFDLMSKQYELARVDESREGALIQVIDPAMPAERKSKPKRSYISVGVAALATLLIATWLIIRDGRRRTLQI